MLKGSYRFAKESILKRNRHTNVCEGATATCGPPGHPCETCMHLKGLHPDVAENRDLCLIAPRSLVRPVQYKRYFNRGVTVPPYLPASKVSGELKEVAVPEPCSREQLQEMIQRQRRTDANFKWKDAGETETPYLISNNVYIEHQGRFTKAPGHLMELNDYTTRVCYLEDFHGPEFNSPLDCAILFQKVWTNVVKIIFGILAGAALVHISICVALVPNAEQDDLSAFFNTYPRVCYIFLACTSILTILTIIAIFDWLDLAHLNFQHAWDTYLHRSIWILVITVIVAYFLFLLNGDLNNEFFLHGAEWSSWETEDARATSILDNLVDVFRQRLHSWKVRVLGMSSLIVSSWILLIITRNDDLFLMHLECMKKYDCHQLKMTHPRILPP